MADKITRDKLVNPDVFKIGPDYAKSLKPAVEANEKWLQSFAEIKAAALEYSNIEKSFKLSPDRAKFLEIKKKEEDLRKKAAQAVKAEQDALTAKLKVDKEGLAVEAKKMTIDAQKQRSSKQAVANSVAERLERQRANRLEKEEAILKSKTSTIIDQLNVKRSREIKVIQDFQARQSLGQRLSKAEQEQLNKSTAAFTKYDNAIKIAKTSTKQFQENVGNYPKQFGVATASVRQFVNALGFTSTIFLLAGAVRNAVKIFRDFDQAQADLAAILGKSRNEISALTAQARELGATTAYTATQISALQLELSKLGFNEQEVLAATQGVENFAIATGVDAARAAKLAGAAIRGFALDASEANKVASVLAVSTTKSASSFETLEVALPKVSAIAKSFGFTIEDTTALLGGLQNAGFEASIAGTSLRQIFLQLADSNGKLAKRLGGGAKDFDELIDQFKKVEKEGISLGEAFNLTNARSVAAFKVFLSGAEDIRTLRNSITDVEPELDKLAKEKLNSINGEMILLNSAWEGWILNLDNSGEAANSIKGAISALTQNLDKVLNTVVALIKSFLIYKGIMLSISIATRVYTASTVALNIAQIALKNGLKAARIEMTALNVATKANPIGILLSVVAAGVATWYAFKDGVNGATDALNRLKDSYDGLKNKIIENDIALIDSRLSNIDAEIEDEKEKNKQKLDLLNQEIDTRETGVNRMYDNIDEIRQKDLEKEKQANAQSIDQNKAYFDELAQARREGRAPRAVSPQPQTPQQGVQVSYQPFSGVTPQAAADDAVIEELKKRRLQLIRDLDKINKKHSEEESREAKKLREKLKNDAYNLNKFLLEQQIEFLDQLSQNERTDFDTRKEAIDARAEEEIALAQLTAKHKFDASKRFAQSEIDQIIETGKITIDQRKKMTDEELLIFAEYVAKKNEILKNQDKDVVNNEVDKIKADAEIQKNINEKLLNDKLDQENGYFKATISNYKTLEDAIKAHEQRVAEIKKQYALEALDVQVNAIKQLLESSELSASQRAEYEKELSELILEISDLNTDHIVKNDEKEKLSQIEKAEQILDISQRLASALIDLANAIFDAKIQNIEQEIEREQEKTDRYLENEHLSDEQKKEIELKAEQRRLELEEKKRKEQRKQAILNKALALVDVGIATALGIMQSYAQLGPIAGSVGAVLVAALGAIQTAAIIAKPIPKFARGTDWFEGGPAMVGEGKRNGKFVPEIVEEPGKDPYIISEPTILNLARGTRITPTSDDYDSMMKQNVVKAMDADNRKLIEYQFKNQHNDSKALLNEMRLTREAIKNQKTNVDVQTEKVDIPHALFSFKNTKWN
jgi:TP901 family phage tail tape measure protein